MNIYKIEHFARTMALSVLWLLAVHHVMLTFIDYTFAELTRNDQND